MSDRVQVTPNGADGYKSPAMQRLLTEKELARRQMERAEAAVEVAEAALNNANAAWHEANDVRCQRQAALTAYQQAQATKTRISELKLRYYGAVALLVGSLFVSVRQVSHDSSLVVLLLFSLPLAWYALAKARQLRGLQRLRQVYPPESEYQALVKREQRLTAIAAKKSEGYPALVARHQAALADLTYWRHEFRRCKHSIDALHVAEQRAKQSEPRKSLTTPR
jgi:hypothetical protein